MGHHHDSTGDDHCDHPSGPAQTNSASRRLWVSIALTLIFVGGEAVAGMASHSLALLSDAGHNFADALALMLSVFAIWMAKGPAGPSRTYGFHRVGILVALVNAVSLVAIAIGIFWEAVQRLNHPEPLDTTYMIWVAGVAVLLNGFIGLSLHKGAKSDLNMRSAYIHMLGDAVAALGVVAAGLIIRATGWLIADPLVSFLIGGLILYSSWGILAEAVNVLLESSPTGLDMAKVESSIRSTPGVLDAHDLHVWTVASGVVACSCHVLVAEQSVRAGEQVLRHVAERLKHDFHITHTTVQIEVEGCEINDMYCTLDPPKEAHHGHAH